MASKNNTSLMATFSPTRTAKHTTGEEGYAWCALFITEALIIITLNILTITVFVKTPCVRKRSTYLPINLSVTDMCVGAVVIPTSIFRRGNSYGLWNVEIDRAWFISTYGIDNFFFGCSLLFLVSISIERLQATRYPMRHRLVLSSSYKIWIFGIWAASGIYASITVSFLHFNILGLHLWYIIAGYVLLSLLVLSCCYMAIFVTVRYSKQPELGNRARKQRKLTVTLFIVTLVSLSVWLPYVLFTFLEVKLTQAFSEETLLRMRSVCEMLFFANSFVNPILYTIRMPEFRKAICSLLSISFPFPLKICSNTKSPSKRRRKYSLR